MEQTELEKYKKIRNNHPHGDEDYDFIVYEFSEEAITQVIQQREGAKLREFEDWYSKNVDPAHGIYPQAISDYLKSHSSKES